jgi:sulfur carrier protein
MTWRWSATTTPGTSPEETIMKICLNNKEVSMAGESLSVRELLTVMKFTFPMIIIKINGRLVKKEDYERVFIGDGDQVEAIHLISGG